jgi:hypothetical protein
VLFGNRVLFADTTKKAKLPKNSNNTGNITNRFLTGILDEIKITRHFYTI